MAVQLQARSSLRDLRQQELLKVAGVATAASLHLLLPSGHPLAPSSVAVVTLGTLEAVSLLHFLTISRVNALRQQSPDAKLQRKEEEREQQSLAEGQVGILPSVLAQAWLQKALICLLLALALRRGLLMLGVQGGVKSLGVAFIGGGILRTLLRRRGREDEDKEEAETAPPAAAGAVDVCPYQEGFWAELESEGQALGEESASADEKHAQDERCSCGLYHETFCPHSTEFWEDFAPSTEKEEEEESAAEVQHVASDSR